MLDTTVSAAEQAAEMQFWNTLVSGGKAIAIILIIILLIVMGLKVYIGINKMKQDLKDIKKRRKEK